MEKTKVNKVPPQVVRERLSKDVHAILSVCIRQFDDAHRTVKDECFDVDAVIAGRSHASDGGYARRVTPAAYAKASASVTESETAHVLSIPQKGYFIPSLRASRKAFA